MTSDTEIDTETDVHREIETEGDSGQWRELAEWRRDVHEDVNRSSSLTSHRAAAAAAAAADDDDDDDDEWTRIS